MARLGAIHAHTAQVELRHACCQAAGPAHPRRLGQPIGGACQFHQFAGPGRWQGAFSLLQQCIIGAQVCGQLARSLGVGPKRLLAPQGAGVLLMDCSRAIGCKLEEGVFPGLVGSGCLQIRRLLTCRLCAFCLAAPAGAQQQPSELNSRLALSRTGQPRSVAALEQVQFVTRRADEHVFRWICRLCVGGVCVGVLVGCKEVELVCEGLSVAADCPRRSCGEKITHNKLGGMASKTNGPICVCVCD